MARLCLALFLLSATAALNAQTHTPRVISINARCGGYYEYLPEGYQPSGAPYPLIVFVHGQGQEGNGSSDLSLLLAAGIPKVINDGQFPKSFVVSNQTFRFIVISPQFSSWPTAADVEAVVSYATGTYNVDERRIYLTGMSMGGGATWDYAGNNTIYSAKLAAIVPVCGASTPNSTTARNIAVTNLPVWATHNQTDPQVPVSNTDGYINLINSNSPPPTPLAKKTIFPVTGHDAWTTTYSPSFEENGLNVYEWMLQYQRTAASPLPVTLTDFRVSNAGGQVQLNWKTSSENKNHHFTLERSADGTWFSPLADIDALNQPAGGSYAYTDKQPLAGRNYYRLSQTDIDGKKTMLGVRELLLDIGPRNWLLYPNPANDHFILGIDQQEAGALTLQIIDAQGKIVRTDFYVKQAGYWQQRVPVAQLRRGIYTIHLKSDHFETTHKLVKN